MGEEIKASLFQYEQELYDLGIELICGVDEAGRGPLAGPVTAAAVIFKAGFILEGIDDSKKLTDKKRRQLLPIIKENSTWSIGIASEKEIDQVNILNATFLAMQRAVAGLEITPQLVLVDGNRDPKLSLPTKTIVGGDGISASIAAASIIAKVTRDDIMLELDKKYPQYNFAKHKGYPTKEHYKLLGDFGLSPCHRESFFKRHKI